jgi:hypothetical protein
MSTTHRSPSEEIPTKNLPLFFITLPRTVKSQEIFRLTALCHIAIRVEAYWAQNCLTQCHNCQKFSHVSANCRQPPRCLRCGRSHLHSVQRRGMLPLLQHTATAGWLRERNPIPPTIRDADMRRRSFRRGNRRKRLTLHMEGCSPSTLLCQVSPSQQRSKAV